MEGVFLSDFEYEQMILTILKSLLNMHLRIVSFNVKITSTFFKLKIWVSG